jgi:hypothetical protein
MDHLATLVRNEAAGIWQQKKVPATKNGGKKWREKSGAVFCAAFAADVERIRQNVHKKVGQCVCECFQGD